MSKFIEKYVCLTNENFVDDNLKHIFVFASFKRTVVTSSVYLPI